MISKTQTPGTERARDERREGGPRYGGGSSPLVRDDSALGAHEDLDRKPGGFPHRSMAMTVLLTIIAATLVFVVLTRSSVFVAVLSAAFVAVAIVAIRRMAARDRDHVHPSR